jgi:hypothetical protein
MLLHDINWKLCPCSKNVASNFICQVFQYCPKIVSWAHFIWLELYEMVVYSHTIFRIMLLSNDCQVHPIIPVSTETKSCYCKGNISVQIICWSKTCQSSGINSHCDCTLIAKCVSAGVSGEPLCVCWCSVGILELNGSESCIFWLWLWVGSSA